MKQEYIILRDLQKASPNRQERGGFTIAIPELHELSLNEAEVIRREKDIIAIAPNLPVELVARSRIDEQAPDQPDDDEVPWGWKAMGLTESSFDGSGTVAAIIDSGIDFRHPAFAHVDLHERDFTGDGDGDSHGHGTHAAGILFGGEVNGTRIGGAPRVDYALVAKVLDEQGKGDSWALAQALLWAVENGANAIVLSMRFDFTGYVQQLIDLGYPLDVATPVALEAYHDTLALYEKYIAILRLTSDGLVVVAGVGDANQTSQNLAWDKSADAPARINGIISVGALRRNTDEFCLAGFSNSGALGVAPGVGVISAEANTKGSTLKDGTSTAACHVGAAALHWAQFLKEQDSLTSFSLEAKLVTAADGLRLGKGNGEFGIGLFTTPNHQSEPLSFDPPISRTLTEPEYQIDSIDVQELKDLILTSARKRRSGGNGYAKTD